MLAGISLKMCSGEPDDDDNNNKPVIIGATGTISESLALYLSDGPGKHGIKELRTAAILGTAHRLWEVLM